VNDNRLDPNTKFYAQSANIPSYTTQQWLTQNAQTATYDATGNLLKLGTRGYGYNALNQLTSVSDSTTVKGTYNYGPNGFRVKKVAGGKTIYFVYLPNGQLLGEYETATGGFHVDREHVYLRGAPIAVLSDSPTSNVTATQKVAPMTLHYVSTDALGTPRKITRASDNLLSWQWLQDDPNGINQPTVPTGGISYNLRFAGQYFDSETGLHENRYRFYDPKTGRYLQADPIGLAGGMHRYGYVAGDPVNAIDPLGLARTTVDAAIQQALTKGNVSELETILEAASTNEERIAARSALDRLNTRVGEIISKECKGSINREFPGQYRDKTLAEIIQDKNSGDAIAKKAWKLINDNRFQK
jgi:RHS repeat-associated protein